MKTLRMVWCAAAMAGVFGWCGNAQAQEKTNATAELLEELIRVDTSNPPGNEGKLAELLATKLRPLGFEIDIIPTPQPGKAHFVARLKGDGTRKPVLIAAHEDVVGVEREKWSMDPFAGVVKDGYVYGRGALDFKGGMAVFLEAAMRLAKVRMARHRDLIFLAEADEEGGKYNTSWLAESHWNLMDCEFALNEGGWIMKNPKGEVQYVSISTADKMSIPLIVTAKGTSTHSSMPRPDNAIFTLSKAMAKLADYETPLELIPSTREFLRTLAKTSEAPMSAYFEELASGTDPEKVREADREVSKDPLLHAIIRNTIAPVFLKAGFRGNVIPGSAEATLNLRVIPGTNVETLREDIERTIGDSRVTAEFPGADTPEGERVARLLKTVAKQQPSSTDTGLYRALEASAKELWPSAPVTAYLFQAGTDAGAWRSRGVPVYGIYPYPISSDDLTRMHGNDERISVESLEQGTEMIYKTLVRVETE